MPLNCHPFSTSYFGRALLEKITIALGLIIPLALFVGGCGVSVPESNPADISPPSVEAPQLDLDAVNIPGLPPGMKDTVGGAIFNKLGTTLSGVTDEASAEAAIPELTNVSITMSDLARVLKPEAKGPTGKLVSMFLPQLEHQIATVKAIPGVGAILDSILGTIMAKAKDLAG